MRMALHVVRGLMTAAIRFPRLDEPRRMLEVRQWSARLLAILSVRIEAHGNPPRPGEPAMIVANHVSWLDIIALNAVSTARFVAKSEIRRWPLIGWLVAQGGTIFIERARRHHVAHVNREVEAALKHGATFAVFPEGVITRGDVLKPFHASVLQPALTCDATLYPVAIRYTRDDGSLCREADYADNKTLLRSLLAMVTQPVIHARLDFLTPVSCNGRERRELARATEELIASALDLPAPSRRAGRGAGPAA